MTLQKDSNNFHYFRLGLREVSLPQFFHGLDHSQVFTFIIFLKFQGKGLLNDGMEGGDTLQLNGPV